MIKNRKVFKLLLVSMASGAGINMKNFEGLIMPRKSYDVFKDDKPIVFSATVTADSLLQNARNRYKPGEERWDEMDQYWSREHAAFLVSPSTYPEYHNYLPGRYYTYDTLADVINDCLGGKEGKRAEIGCGSGICLVIQAMKGAEEVHGFDKSYASIDFFETLAKRYNVHDKVRVKQGHFYSTGYENNQFDATFNVGVFEHLGEKDQKKLITEMVRTTRPGGVILVSIPNPTSPLAKYTREKEKTIFSKLKEYIFPLSKEDYPVDLKKLFEEANIKIENESAVLIAPPSEIPQSHLKGRLKQLYDKIPKMGRPDDVIELMKFWSIMEEKVATRKELNEVGWYKYIVGHKPG